MGLAGGVRCPTSGWQSRMELVVLKGPATTRMKEELGQKELAPTKLQVPAVLQTGAQHNQKAGSCARPDQASSRIGCYTGVPSNMGGSVKADGPSSTQEEVVPTPEAIRLPSSPEMSNRRPGEASIPRRDAQPALTAAPHGQPPCPRQPSQRAGPQRALNSLPPYHAAGRPAAGGRAWRRL